MAITFAAVSWDVIGDQVQPKDREEREWLRPGESDVTILFGTDRYLPQDLHVRSIETTMANANTQITNAKAQEKTNVTLTDQFGETHTITVLKFNGVKKELCDGTWEVIGVYRVIKY